MVLAKAERVGGCRVLTAEGPPSRDETETAGSLLSGRKGVFESVAGDSIPSPARLGRCPSVDRAFSFLVGGSRGDQAWRESCSC